MDTILARSYFYVIISSNLFYMSEKFVLRDNGQIVIPKELFYKLSESAESILAHLNGYTESGNLPFGLLLSQLANFVIANNSADFVKNNFKLTEHLAKQALKSLHNSLENNFKIKTTNSWMHFSAPFGDRTVKTVAKMHLNEGKTEYFTIGLVPKFYRRLDLLDVNSEEDFTAKMQSFTDAVSEVANKVYEYARKRDLYFSLKVLASVDEFSFTQDHLVMHFPNLSIHEFDDFKGNLAEFSKGTALQRHFYRADCGFDIISSDASRLEDQSFSQILSMILLRNILHLYKEGKLKTIRTEDFAKLLLEMIAGHSFKDAKHILRDFTDSFRELRSGQN